MSEPYDLLLVVGRFHPFCDSHRVAIEAVAWRADHVEVVVIGDDIPRSARYPFTTRERLAMLTAEGYAAVALPEVLTVDERLAQIDRLAGDRGVTILAFDADFENVSAPKLTAVGEAERDSDAIRIAWLEARPFEGVSDKTRQILWDIGSGPEFDGLRDEHSYILKYQQDWKAAPYPPVFVTVDTLIIHDGKVLLIKRGGLPGRGQWALPGGFLDRGEALFEAALRELHEETGLRLSPQDGRARLKSQRVFDQPERSARGRTLTHAFCFDLSGLDLPDIIAGDDAAAAKWTGVDCALRMRKHMFEDHYLILECFLK